MSDGRARVICISHEEGAEGTLVGRAVSEELAMRYVDEEIIVQAAEKGGVDAGLLAGAEARRSLVLRLIEQLHVAGTTANVPSVPLPEVEFDRNRELIVEVIRETAKQGDVVIVAHAASVALAGRSDLLRVLVTAPVDVRARRVAESSGVSDDRALKQVRTSDAGRASYFKRFYGVGSELPTHYDLIVNTEALTPDDAASLVVQAARFEGRTDGVGSPGATGEPSDV
jgi:cytidylate kinase